MAREPTTGGRLAILWHLHQPDYRDPETAEPVMPWARLHALRGYRDLLVETAERGVRWTINLVPSLLDQLEVYALGGSDPHLAATRADADSVDPLRVAALPAGHPAMTRARPPYAALRGRLDRGERLSVGELRDLQVWATLSWFGATALRDHPALRELIAKGREFTEGDKAVMLAVHDEIVASIPTLIRRVARSEGPTLSVSPYHHPILPLLVDAASARRALPHLPDDIRFAWPQDAREQLTSARDRLARATGRLPGGLWPSEGSVSPEVAALAAEAGFRWLATDRAVLERSDHGPADRAGGWDLGGGLIGWFRDTELSDRIGFRYAGIPAESAAADLVAEAARRVGDGVLLVALDGENPWEAFPDAGGAFRRALLDRLERSGPAPIGLDEASEHPPVGTVRRLHTGSWIGGDFRIWAGHREDRAAWRALAEVRAASERAAPERRAAAMAHLLVAEGSDWFWWYGDDFETPWAGAFDALFRGRLRAAWVALGQEPPEALDRPIREPRPPDHRPPDRFLPIDRSTPRGWAAWAGAGDLRPRTSTMADATGVRRLRYGWERGPHGRAGALWVRVDTGEPGWAFDPPPDEVFLVRGGLVGRYPPSGATLSIVHPSGARWPDDPLVLAPPQHPSLLWWEV